MTFYFTYGSWESYPYQAGWTTVHAPDRQTAVKLFRLYHPDVTPGIVCCADIYTEEQFRNTRMYEKGNGGEREQEEITLTIKYNLPWLD